MLWMIAYNSEKHLIKNNWNHSKEQATILQQTWTWHSFLEYGNIYTDGEAQVDMFVYCFGNLCEVGVRETPLQTIWKMQQII